MANIVFDPRNLAGPPVDLPQWRGPAPKPAAASKAASAPVAAAGAAADPWAAFPDAPPQPAAPAPEPIAPVQASAIPAAQPAAAADPWAAFPDAPDAPAGWTNVSGQNVGRSALRGIPILGSALDEIGAGIQATVAPALNAISPTLAPGQAQPSWAERYDAALRQARGMDTAFDTAHPYISTAAQLVGGTLATLPLGATAAGAKLLGLSGDTMLGRIGAGMTSGAGIGAASGFLGGEGDNRLGSAASGAGIGLGLGAAAPLVGAAAGKIVSGVGRGTTWLKQAVSDSQPLREAATLLGHGGPEPVTVAVAPHIIAAKKLAGMLHSDAVTKEAAAANPDAMLAELGPNLGDTAGGIVAKPGSEGPLLIRNATADAKARAAQGVRDTMDEVLGKRANVPQTLEDLLDQRAAQSKQPYEDALSRMVRWSPRLQQFLDEPIAKPALALGAKIQRLEALADNEPFNPTDYALKIGPDGEYVASTTPNMRTLNVLKKGLDAMVSASKDPQTGRLSEQGRAIFKVLKSYRSLLDVMNPDYAVARKAWEGPSKVYDAVLAGQKVFDRTISPDDLRRELTDMNDAERAGYIMGARQQIAQIMGTGRSDATAAVARFRQEWNPEKLRLLVGKPQADRMMSALERMQKITEFENAIVHNSKTASRQAAQQALQDQSFMRHTLGTGKVVFGIGGIRGLTKLGIVHLAESILGSHDEARNEQVAAIIARGLISRGEERDALIRALNRGLAQMDAVERRSSMAAAVVRALTSSAGAAGTPPLTRYANSPAQ